jgi:methyl-accepting chemotaxis protein
MLLPKLSIAAKLYAIFALMATATAALAAVAITEAHHHAALTGEFESANAGTLNVEKVNGLIYAVVMESRGVYMSSDMKTSAVYARGIREFNKQISKVVEDWRKSVRGDDAQMFSQFSNRIALFIDFREELARLGMEVSPAAGREWGDNDANRAVRKALNSDLEQLTRIYSTRAQRLYAEIDDGISRIAMWLTFLGAFTLVLAGIGAWVIAKSVVRPIERITRVTEEVALGNAGIKIPFSARKDEIGALARSIAIFQKAMFTNDELTRTVRADAEGRLQRQEQVSTEIARFSSEVETTIAELGRISDQMLAASTRLASVADDASIKTEQATTASFEASANVRDIASAAEELSVSVKEIDRQVAQSNDIATKAVNEAERTNMAVKELDEAAGRIGDVVKLITGIAEQTNLLALNATRARGRGGARLCRRRRRSEGARGADEPGDGRDCRADRRHAAGDGPLDRSNRRDRAHHSRDRRDQWRDRRGGDRAGPGDGGNRAQRRRCCAPHRADRGRGQSRRHRDGRDARQRGRGEGGVRRSRQRRRAQPRAGRRVLPAAERLMQMAGTSPAISQFARE